MDRLCEKWGHFKNHKDIAAEKAHILGTRNKMWKMSYRM